MRHIFFSILTLGLFLTCTSDAKVSESNEEGKTPKGNMETTGNVAASTLALLEEVNKNPNDHDGNSQKLNKVANAFISAKKTTQGVKLLEQAIRNHYSAPYTAQNAFDLMNVYKNRYGDSGNQVIMAQAIKTSFPTFSKMDEVEKNIPSDSKGILETINEIRANMTDKETGRLDLKQANRYITYSEIYALMMPKEKIVPELLQKAGEVARSIRAYPKSIEIYDWILDKYGDTKFASQALFMKAFTFDNELNDKKKAKAFYEAFLKKYPKDSFADDTKFLLDNIGKTNEDIIKSFNGIKANKGTTGDNSKDNAKGTKKAPSKKQKVREN